MDNVLGFLATIILVSSVQSSDHHTRLKRESCSPFCPPGFYSLHVCDGLPGHHLCKKCDPNTFTAIKNTHPQCERCRSCPAGAVERSKCNATSDTLCDCKDGYYWTDSNSTCKACKECIDNNPACRRECQPCQRSECLMNEECKKKCKAPASATATTTLSLFTNTVTTEAEGRVHWYFLVIVVTLLLFLWLVIFSTTNLLRKAQSCLCWRKSKNEAADGPKTHERGRLQGCSQTTLTLNTSAEPSIMCSSQNSTGSVPPAHMSPLLPVHPSPTAAGPDEQTEKWPAIVLYAIINAVPPRRWKEFVRLLSMADQQLERVELEAGLGHSFIEKQYQMVKLWSQHSTASLREVFSALHYMELSGCAQMLQERLDKLPWEHRSKRGLLSWSASTDCEPCDVVHDTGIDISGDM